MRRGEFASIFMAPCKKLIFSRRFTGWTAVGAIALAAGPASAQVGFTLASSTAKVSPGGEAYFTGTITNNSTTVIYLNGLQVEQEADTTPSSGVFTPDTSPFFTNAPTTLAVGGTFTGQIFGIQATSAITPSSEFDGTVAVLGGTSSSTDAVIAGPLSFMVFDASSATPEPQSLPLAVIGIATVAGLARRRIARRR